jgi:hypothetical protein
MNRDIWICNNSVMSERVPALVMMPVAESVSGAVGKSRRRKTAGNSGSCFVFVQRPWPQDRHPSFDSGQLFLASLLL